VVGETSDTIGKLAAENGITLFELAPRRASLEEAFMQMTGGSVEYHGAGFDQVMGGAL
jgi:ABC-2 type transport system ATP-binding protein